MDINSIQITLFGGVFAIAMLLINPCKNFFGISEVENSRLQYLDGLRGIAALLVVACHINQHLLTFFQISDVPNTANNLGIIGVEIFFALTSYLFTKRALEGKFNPTTFYLARVKRIVPLYLFVAAITILVTFSFAKANIPNWHSFLRDCINVLTYGFIGEKTLIIEGFNALQLMGIAWSLSYEWKFYLILPALYSLFIISKRLSILVCVAITVVAVRDFYEDPNHLAIWPFFLIGSFSAIISASINLRIKRGDGFLFILAVACIVYATTFTAFSYPQFFLIFLSFLCILTAKPKYLMFKPFVNLGQISYSIYLLQYIVLMPMVQLAWAKDVFHASPALKFMVAFLVIIFLIPFSCFTYKYIEQYWMKQKAGSTLGLKAELPA